MYIKVKNIGFMFNYPDKYSITEDSDTYINTKQIVEVRKSEYLKDKKIVEIFLSNNRTVYYYGTVSGFLKRIRERCDNLQ